MKLTATELDRLRTARGLTLAHLLEKYATTRVPKYIIMSDVHLAIEADSILHSKFNDATGNTVIEIIFEALQKTKYFKPPKLRSRRRA